MATQVMGHVAAPGETSGTDDPFHDPVMLGLGIVFVVVTLTILMMTGLVYWGIEHHLPAWSAHSFPPPVVH